MSQKKIEPIRTFAKYWWIIQDPDGGRGEVSIRVSECNYNPDTKTVSVDSMDLMDVVQSDGEHAEILDDWVQLPDGTKITRKDGLIVETW